MYNFKKIIISSLVASACAMGANASYFDCGSYKTSYIGNLSSAYVGVTSIQKAFFALDQGGMLVNMHYSLAKNNLDMVPISDGYSYGGCTLTAGSISNNNSALEQRIANLENKVYSCIP